MAGRNVQRRLRITQWARGLGIATIMSVPVVAAAGAEQGPVAEIVPQGVFFHSFTGQFSTMEWATFAVASPPIYRFADIRAAGAYNCSINNGAVLFFGGIGNGLFTSSDTATLDFDFGGGVTFHSQLQRVPMTDASFPVFLNSPEAADASLAGDWVSVTRRFDPQTEAVIETIEETVSVSTGGDTIRITRPNGDYYQAVVESPELAALRSIFPTPTNALYRTFPGCETNVGQNVIGEIRIAGAESMAATLLLETYAQPPGIVTTSMLHLELSRKPPRVSDLDGSGVVDALDFLQLIAAWGPCSSPCPEDLDDSGFVDALDFLILLSEWG